MLEKLQHENKVIGMKQVARSVREGVGVQQIYLAQDADSHMINKIYELAEENHIEIVSVESRKKLGKFCGIDVGATVVAVLK